MFGLFKKRPPDSPLPRIEVHLKIMGYDLVPYGVGVALAESMSGYSDIETASHIAHTTMALDIREAGDDIEKLAAFVPHAVALLDVLKQYREKGMMHPTQYQNDFAAVLRISTVDSQQLQWIDKILSDPIAGKERLAKSRINYNVQSISKDDSGAA